MTAPDNVADEAENIPAAPPRPVQERARRAARARAYDVARDGFAHSDAWRWARAVYAADAIASVGQDEPMADEANHDSGNFVGNCAQSAGLNAADTATKLALLVRKLIASPGVQDLYGAHVDMLLLAASALADLTVLGGRAIELPDAVRTPIDSDAAAEAVLAGLA